jgi:galactokinase
MKPFDACLEAQRLEHEVLKTPCGLLDQMAMMFGKEGHASVIDFSNNSVESHIVPSEWMFKLVDSGIHRTLSDASYRSTTDESIASAHVSSENERVELAVGATAKKLGELLNQSHASLKRRGVSLPEVDALVAALQQTEGVYGARMMGGGFGGMILVLVASEDILPNQRLYRPSQGGFVEEFFE